MKLQFSSTIPVELGLDLEAELSALVSWKADPTEYKIQTMVELNEDSNGYNYEVELEKR